MNLNFLLISIFGFLILSAFFSGSETAFFSLSKIQIKKLENNKNKSSKRIIRLLRNSKELLIIILLGNTIVNVAASSTAALIAINIGESHFQNFSQSIIMLIEIVIMTILLLIFGEIAPKLYAFSSPEKVARSSSLILEVIKFVFWPVIKILELISSLLSVKKHKEEEPDITSEDFKNLIRSKVTHHSLEENEKQIISSIFRFSSTDAKNIMTPRVDMAGVDTSEGLQKVKDTIISSGHSKIPIYKTNIDNIIGIIYAKDIILNPQKSTISSLLRPPLFITENTKIQKLLNKFKRSKILIAIIVDEYGGTEGLITLEDILEEIVGEIRDEYDKEKPNIVQQNKNTYIINGMYTISELNEKFMLDIDEEEYDILADFIYDNFNKVPDENESFIYQDMVKFTVKRVKARRIQYITLEVINNDDES
ncbi:MAG: hemolysin family protein [Candidatus Tenebribacter davisii]|nr:hemolysin family protein [Candidatus Tenebribacter davisii]